MANYILKEMAEGMADGHKTLYPKMQTYSLHNWKSRACLPPEGKAMLTPENFFILTPLKS